MDNTVVSELNKQIQEEFFSAYLYLSMAAYCSSKNLFGFASWFTVQAKEEVDHAMGFYNHLVAQGEKVELLALAKPAGSFGTLLDIAKATLSHEQHITARIKKIYEHAKEEKEYATELFVTWYIKEQVEEEANATILIEKIKMVGDDKTSLYLLDKELTLRTYTPVKIE
ncbi:MAG: ferritin [bacterium]